jgi:hypothetical protein
LSLDKIVVASYIHFMDTEAPDWTVLEAASYAQMNPETLRRKIREGKLPARKDPTGEWLISKVEFAYWLNSHKRWKNMVTMLPGVGLIVRAGIEIAEAVENGQASGSRTKASEISKDADQPQGNLGNEELRRFELELMELDEKISIAEARMLRELGNIRKLSEAKGQVLAELRRLEEGDATPQQ